jgi:preprotein translocase subunit SecD
MARTIIVTLTISAVIVALYLGLLALGAGGGVELSAQVPPALGKGVGQGAETVMARRLEAAGVEGARVRFAGGRVRIRFPATDEATIARVRGLTGDGALRVHLLPDLATDAALRAEEERVLVAAPQLEAADARGRFPGRAHWRGQVARQLGDEVLDEAYRDRYGFVHLERADRPEGQYLMVELGKPIYLTSPDLTSVTRDGAALELTLSPDSDDLETLTRAAAASRRVAIALDGRLLATAPLEQALQGNRLTIRGELDRARAEQARILLSCGDMPAALLWNLTRPPSPR